VKIGPFLRYNVTPSQLLFVAVLLAIVRPLSAFSKYVAVILDKPINIMVFYCLDKHHWQFTLLCLDI
jgi:hypothetical protein